MGELQKVSEHIFDDAVVEWFYDSENDKLHYTARAFPTEILKELNEEFSQSLKEIEKMYGEKIKHIKEIFTKMSYSIEEVPQVTKKQKSKPKGRS